MAYFFGSPGRYRYHSRQPRTSDLQMVTNLGPGLHFLIKLYTKFDFGQPIFKIIATGCSILLFIM